MLSPGQSFAVLEDDDLLFFSHQGSVRFISKASYISTFIFNCFYGNTAVGFFLQQSEVSEDQAHLPLCFAAPMFLLIFP